MPTWLKPPFDRRSRSRSPNSHDRLLTNAAPPPWSLDLHSSTQPQNVTPEQTLSIPSQHESVPADGRSTTSIRSSMMSAIEKLSFRTTPARQSIKRSNLKSPDEDLKRLAIAYLVQGSSDLRKCITLIAGFQRSGGNDREEMKKLAGFCAKFLLQLAELHEVDKKSDPAISEYLSALGRFKDSMKNSSSGLGSTFFDNSMILKDTIASIKQIHPSLVNDPKYMEERWNIVNLIDTPLSILIMLKDGCDLAPVPYLKPAVGIAIGLLNAVKQTRSNQGDMRGIADVTGEFILSLAVICSHHDVEFTNDLKGSIERFTMSLEAIGNECHMSSQQPLLYRFIQQGSIKDKVSDLKMKLDQAIKLFQTETQVLQHGDLQRLESTLNTVNKKMDVDLLNTLPKHPYYTGHRGTDGYVLVSRSDIMEEISTWIDSDDSTNRILWLRGAAGMGKSTMAHQIVDALRGADRLGTYFFFTSGSSDQSDPVTVIKCMAHELASLHPSTTAEIANAVRAPQSGHQPLSTYLAQYIISPIQTISTSRSSVIVLDALNEWVNHLLLLEALKEIENNLSGIKIIITSRPEKRIDDALAKLPVMDIHLKQIDGPTMRMYFDRRFESISWNDRRPTEWKIDQLVDLADGLLIWASTVCEYLSKELQEDEPHRLLDQILMSSKEVSSEKQLVSLYQSTLTHLFGDDGSEYFQRIFGAMFVVKESLGLIEFAKLIELRNAGLVKGVISRLSALQTRGHGESDVILPASNYFHASLLDFSTSQEAPSHLRISIVEAHSSMARSCLRILISYFQVQKGQRAIITKLVSYAAEHWAFHFGAACRNNSPSADLSDTLDEFCENYLRSWIHHEISQTGSFEEGIVPPDFEETDKARLLHHLVVHLDSRVSDVSKIYPRIICLERVVVHLASQDTEKAEYLDYLGDLNVQLFDSMLALTALDDAEEAYREALGLRPPPHPDRYFSLNNLALALRSRFKQRSSVEDLDEAITMHREALDLRHSPHLERSNSLNNLALALHSRFEQRGLVGDLDEAITMHREALNLRHPPHPDRYFSLSNLALALCSRFKQRGSVGDLDEAITMQREALGLRPPPHPDRYFLLNNLAAALYGRFEQRGSVGDLDEAITMHREALNLRFTPHPDRYFSLNNLALALCSRFMQRGSAGDLDEAITMHREALDLHLPSHLERCNSLNNLALALHSRFKQRGSAGDLDEAITMHREALDLRPFPHPERSRLLNNLALALHSRFEQRGSAGDLDEAITMHREALDLRPFPHSESSRLLNNLAFALHRRFEERGSVGDLDDAITMHREALDLRLPPHPDRYFLLNNLADTLHSRFEERGSVGDLDEAITMHREALDLRPPPHLERSSSLNNLAAALHSRFKQRGSVDDLNEAITMHREALNLRHPPHPDRYFSLGNLASALRSRFKQQGSVGDLDEAITMHREALDLCPPPHPGHSELLSKLASALRSRFTLSGSQTDLNEAMSLSSASI